MLRYVVLLALASVALAEFEIPILTCGGNIGSVYLPRDVRTEHCTEEVCTVSLTAPIQFEIDATAPYDTPYLTVHGYMYYSIPDDLEVVIPIPFPVEVMDGCQTLVNSTCPLTSGEEFTTSIDWDWESDLAPDLVVGTTFEMEFRIYDDSETIATCFRVPVVIDE